MAERPAICEEFPSGLPLPALQASDQQIRKAPVRQAGSFSVTGPETLQPKQAYDRYLRLQKSLLTPGNSRRLLAMYRELSQDETNPTYITAAGWAIAEAALITNHKAPEERHDWLEAAEACWQQVHDELYTKSGKGNPGFDREEMRLGAYLAVLPFMHDVVAGTFSRDSSRRVYAEKLAIAKRNDELARQTATQTENGGWLYEGFGYEMLGTLLLDSDLDRRHVTLFPPVRADTGYHYASQTHDLLRVTGGKGRVESAIPIEIKRIVKPLDQHRYSALLLSGEEDLNIDDRSQSETLALVEEAYVDPPSVNAYGLVKRQRAHLLEKIHTYTQGKRIKVGRTWRSRTKFYETAASTQ